MGWDVNGQTAYGTSPLSPTTSATNATVGNLTRGSGFTLLNTAAGNAWGGTGVDNTSLASAITGNDVVTFTVKANTGYTLSLTEISPYNIRKTAAGSTSGQWQYSINGGTYVNIGSTITWGTTTSASGNSQSAVPLSGISALQNLPTTSTVTFRLVVWGATSTTGSWYFNNFQTGSDLIITGELDAVVSCSAPTTQASAITFSGVTSDQVTVGWTNGNGSNRIVKINTTNSFTNCQRYLWRQRRASGV